jgi:UDPglucose--hexose-1-phosphate uridylyltransferase
MNKFIFDELTETPTILATNRAKRADHTGAVTTVIKKQETEEKKPKACPFCPGNESMTPPTLYQDGDPWEVRVFQNKYPLLEDHEVIVHSRDPSKDIEDLDHDANVKIIKAYLDRVSYHGSRDKEVIIFNNRGGKAGASLNHPHSQLVAAKGFPGIVEREKDAALHYFNEHARCYWCDEIQKATQDDRLVFESELFVILIPEACRWSYEMKLVPRNHKPNFGFIDDAEIHDLSDVLKAALNAYNVLFNRPDRNFWIHSMRYEPFHWHMGFIPHIKVFGALELGAGIWVSDKATPQDAAIELRGTGVFDTLKK